MKKIKMILTVCEWLLLILILVMYFEHIRTNGFITTIPVTVIILMLLLLAVLRVKK